MNNDRSSAVIGNRVPILMIDGILVASVQLELHDQSALQFKADVGDRIAQTGAPGLVVDLTAVEVVDSFMGRILNELAQMARLMGTRVVLTGLQPPVAITLVELGMELPGITTALNLEKGMKKLRDLMSKSEGG